LQRSRMRGLQFRNVPHRLTFLMNAAPELAHADYAAMKRRRVEF